MAIPNGAGGYQFGDGNLNEADITVVPVPATASTTATLTAAQILNGIIVASPGSSAAAYTLPLVSDLEATLSSATKPGVSFDFTIINSNGSGSGVITITTNTGWTIGSSGSQGLMTIAATAGTTQRYRARQTSVGAWALYQIA